MSLGARSKKDPLPPDWIAYPSRNHPGKVYFYHSGTRESIWQEEISEVYDLCQSDDNAGLIDVSPEVKLQKVLKTLTNVPTPVEPESTVEESHEKPRSPVSPTDKHPETKHLLLSKSDQESLSNHLSSLSRTSPDHSKNDLQSPLILRYKMGSNPNSLMSTPITNQFAKPEGVEANINSHPNPLIPMDTYSGYSSHTCSPVRSNAIWTNTGSQSGHYSNQTSTDLSTQSSNFNSLNQITFNPPSIQCNSFQRSFETPPTRTNCTSTNRKDAFESDWNPPTSIDYNHGNPDRNQSPQSDQSSGSSGKKNEIWKRFDNFKQPDYPSKKVSLNERLQRARLPVTRVEELDRLNPNSVPNGHAVSLLQSREPPGHPNHPIDLWRNDEKPWPYSDFDDREERHDEMYDCKDRGRHGERFNEMYDTKDRGHFGGRPNDIYNPSDRDGRGGPNNLYDSNDRGGRGGRSNNLCDFNDRGHRGGRRRRARSNASSKSYDRGRPRAGLNVRRNSKDRPVDHKPNFNGMRGTSHNFQSNPNFNDRSHDRREDGGKFDWGRKDRSCNPDFNDRSHDRREDGAMFGGGREDRLCNPDFNNRSHDRREDGAMFGGGREDRSFGRPAGPTSRPSDNSSSRTNTVPWSQQSYQHQTPHRLSAQNRLSKARQEVLNKEKPGAMRKVDPFHSSSDSLPRRTLPRRTSSPLSYQEKVAPEDTFTLPSPHEMLMQFSQQHPDIVQLKPSPPSAKYRNEPRKSVKGMVAKAKECEAEPKEPEHPRKRRSVSSDTESDSEISKKQPRSLKRALSPLRRFSAKESGSKITLTESAKQNSDKLIKSPSGKRVQFKENLEERFAFQRWAVEGESSVDSLLDDEDLSSVGDLLIDESGDLLIDEEEIVCAEEKQVMGFNLCDEPKQLSSHLGEPDSSKDTKRQKDSEARGQFPAQKRLENLRKNLEKRKDASAASTVAVEPIEVDMETGTGSTSDVQSEIISCSSLTNEVEEMDWQDSDIKEEIDRVRKTCNPEKETAVWAPKTTTTQAEFYIVIDTNILLSGVSFVTTLRDTNFKGLGLPTIMIPWQVMHEIDSLKDGDSKVKKNAIKAKNYLYENFSNNHPRVCGQTMKDWKDSWESAGSMVPDDLILFCASNLKKEGKHVIFVTDDKGLFTKAKVEKVECYTKEGMLSKLKAEQESNQGVNIPCQNSPEKKTDQVLDNLVCALKSALLGYFSSVIRKGMLSCFEDKWEKHCCIQPPWTALSDCFTLLEKHVFSICDGFPPTGFRKAAIEAHHFFAAQEKGKQITVSSLMIAMKAIVVTIEFLAAEKAFKKDSLVILEYLEDFKRRLASSSNSPSKTDTRLNCESQPALSSNEAQFSSDLNPVAPTTQPLQDCPMDWQQVDTPAENQQTSQPVSGADAVQILLERCAVYCKDMCGSMCSVLNIPHDLPGVNIIEKKPVDLKEDLSGLQLFIKDLMTSFQSLAKAKENEGTVTINSGDIKEVGIILREFMADHPQDLPPIEISDMDTFLFFVDPTYESTRKIIYEQLEELRKLFLKCLNQFQKMGIY